MEAVGNQVWKLGGFVCRRAVVSAQIFSRVHATLQPALSVGRSVGRLVGWSVCHALLFLSILFL